MGASGRGETKEQWWVFLDEKSRNMSSCCYNDPSGSGAVGHHLPLSWAVVSACSFLSLVTISKVYFLCPWGPGDSCHPGQYPSQDGGKPAGLPGWAAQNPGPAEPAKRTAGTDAPSTEG